MKRKGRTFGIPLSTVTSLPSLPVENKGDDMATSTEIKKSIVEIKGFVTRFVDPFENIVKHLDLALEVELQHEAAVNKLQSVEGRRNDAIKETDKIKEELRLLILKKTNLDHEIVGLRQSVVNLTNGYFNKDQELQAACLLTIETDNKNHELHKKDLQNEIDDLTNRRDTLREALKGNLKTVEELTR
jgi:hypothetical protein